MEGDVKVRGTGAGEGVVVRQHAGMTRPDHFQREHSHTRAEPAHGLVERVPFKRRKSVPREATMHLRLLDVD